MARYTSNRFKDIVIGLPNYSELKTSLQIVGKVGIGTNDAKTPLWIEGNTNIAGIITATTFKKEGGTNSEFLMADGSVNNLSYLTSETSTLDDILGRGNSTTKNLSVGIITASSIVGIATTALLAKGLTGTPSIVVDQITANNVSVAQTLTYEDVTSVDSVGMVTARSGIYVGPINAGVATITSDGNATFAGIITSGQLNVTGITTLSETDINGDLSLKKTINTQYSPTTNVTPIITIRNDASLNNSFASLRLQAHNDNAAAAAFNIAVLNSSTDYKSTLVFQSRDGENSFSEKVRITSGGNVGIGSTIPDTKLDVDGTITATSFSVTGAAAGAVLMADGTTNALNAEKLIDANDATRVEANIHGAFVSGILTATSFSGALTGDVTGDTSGSSGSCTGNSLTATDLSINATNRLLYQSANNSTDIMVEGNSGQVLQSNGDGNVPTWVDAAPSSAISGLTLRQDGDQVGDASGVSQINFVGAAVTFTSTAGLGTVTIQTESVSSVIMSMIF